MLELLGEIYQNSSEYIAVEKDQDPYVIEEPFERVRFKDRARYITLKPFQLYGGDGNPILHSLWSLVIEPGELITMRFHDEKLNGVGAHSVTLVERSMEWVRSWWGRSQIKKIDRDPKTRVRLARSPDVVVSWLAGDESESGSGSNDSLVEY
jgi:hypothetical protein